MATQLTLMKRKGKQNQEQNWEMMTDTAVSTSEGKLDFSGANENFFLQIRKKHSVNKKKYK